MKDIERELNAVKFIAFGKVKVKENRKNNDNFEKLLAKKSELMQKTDNNANRTQELEMLDEQLCKELQVKQKVEVEKELNKLYELKTKKGKSAAIFELKEKIVGQRKIPEEPCAVIDPVTRKYVFEPKKIIKVCADYCQNLLKNDKPKDDFVEDLLWKR